MNLNVTVINVANPQQRRNISFRADPERIDCIAPASHLRSIGIAPHSRRTRKSSDGSEVMVDVGAAELLFLGVTVCVDVLFGENEDERILGLTALQSAGIEVDSNTQQVTRSPAIRLK